MTRLAFSRHGRRMSKLPFVFFILGILAVTLGAITIKKMSQPVFIQGYRTVRPQRSNDVILNPGKGWVLYGLPSDHLSSTMAYATVGYTRFEWSSIEPEEDQYNWSIIDSALNAWKAQGKQFAFGVMNANSSDWNIQYVTPRWVFDDGANYVKSQVFNDLVKKSGVQYEPVWNDPIFLQKLQVFVAALAQRYDNNPNIAFVDVRSYGNWGEQHVYGIYPSIALAPEDVQKLIQLYKNAFKHVLIVVPWGTSDYNSIYDWAVDNHIGMRRDGIMVDSSGSELTRANGKASSVFEFYATYQWLVQNGFWSDAELQKDVNIGKPSYIGMGQWGNDANIMAVKEQTLISKLANQMGYYFVLMGAVIPTAVMDDQPVNIHLSWSNQGVTYLYEPCKIAIALLDKSNNVIQKQWFTRANPNAWTPGKVSVEKTSVTFTDIVPGTYKIAVGLFQNAAQRNPIYKIGNQGRTANGWYMLDSDVSVIADGL